MDQRHVYVVIVVVVFVGHTYPLNSVCVGEAPDLVNQLLLPLGADLVYTRSMYNSHLDNPLGKPCLERGSVVIGRSSTCRL